MFNSIELQMLLEDAASLTKAKVSKTSLIRASVLKDNKLKMKVLCYLQSEKI